MLESATAAHALAPDVVYAGGGSNVGDYDTADLSNDDKMLIRKGDDKTANNLNKGFVNLNLSKVTSEEAVAEGINPKYWTKGADGYWYPIVTDEKEAYQKDGDWNYKTSIAGDVQWTRTNATWRINNVFVRRATQNVDTFVITEKGYLRRASDEFAAANAPGHDASKVYANTYLASMGTFGTVSEAGKDGYVAAIANDDYALVDEFQAMFYGVDNQNDFATYKDKNDLNVGQINNEYFNVKPAEGYFLDYGKQFGVAADQVGNYFYTDDYKTACDFNSRDYMYLNGKLVRKTPFNFTADEEKDARFCKDGYLRFAGAYYKIIAEKPTSNNNWLPSTYVYNKPSYGTNDICVYDNTKTKTWEQASRATDESIVLPGYVKVDVGVDAVYGVADLHTRTFLFKEVTVSAKPAGGYNNDVFDLFDDNDVEWTKQLTANGRFYLTK